MPVNLDSVQLPFTTIEAVEKQIAEGYSARVRKSGIQQMSQVTTQLGIVEAGEVRLGSVLPGSGFSGLRLGYPPFIYNSESWNLVGIDNDILQIGIRASDGVLFAGAGKVLLSVDGITFDVSDDPAEFTETRSLFWKDGATPVIELSGFQDGFQPGITLRTNQGDASGLGASTIDLTTIGDGDNAGSRIVMNAGSSTGQISIQIGDGVGFANVIFIESDLVTFLQPVQLDNYLDIAEISAPGTPASGYGRLYSKTDSLPYYKDDSGVEHALTGAGLAGKETKWIGARDIFPAVTNGCSTLQTVELSSTNPNVQLLDFSHLADEFGQFSIVFPKRWNAGTVTFKVFWTNNGTETDGVAWALQAVALADGDDLDTAYGTAIVVQDDALGISGGVIKTTVESSAVTIAGSPGDVELSQFQIFRDISDANDDMTRDARLLGIQVFWTATTLNDN